MKTTLTLTLLCLLSLATFAKPKMAVLKAKLACHKCEVKITNQLADLDGVEDLKVWAEKNSLAVKYDPKETDIQKIITELKTIGYLVSEYVIDGKDKVILKPETTKKKKTAQN